MIDKFSVLYVGHIDMENIGAKGTPADERRYSNERLIEALDNATHLAKLMDSRGFYALWTAEHHFQREGYECLPNLILLSTYLATQTKNLKFGCAFNIVPMWHPLRLAEDFAMADILTNGRVIFGVGRGYHSREVESFGSPVIDNDANKELFLEQMEIIFKAFNEDSFSHQGKHYTIPAQVPYRGYDLEEVTLVPRPIHRPVEIWQPISSGKSLEYMASKGIKAMVALTGEKLVDKMFREYQGLSAKHGRHLELGENMALSVGFYLADTQEEAIRRIRDSHDERYKWFAPFGFVRYTHEDGTPWGTPGSPARTPRIEDGVAQKAWICGPPENFVDFIKETQEKYPGLEQILVQWPEGMPRKDFSEQLKVFSDEVMPHFPSRTAPASPVATAASAEDGG